MTVGRDKWTFSEYVYELEYLAEIQEVPGATVAIKVLLEEVKKKYPEDCKKLGIT